MLWPTSDSIVHEMTQQGASIWSPIVLRFEPSTVGHLGSNMYSHLPNSVAELIANAYDADAKVVVVKIGADDLGDFVSVIDDGHGMSLEDLASKYLRIGRNRRNELQTGLSESGQRKVSGKKGIGKLALFGVGHLVEVATSRQESDTLHKVSLDYEEMLDSEGEYRPGVGSDLTDSEQHGTKITIRRLVRRNPSGRMTCAEVLPASSTTETRLSGCSLRISAEKKPKSRRKLDLTEPHPNFNGLSKIRRLRESSDPHRGLSSQQMKSAGGLSRPPHPLTGQTAG